MKKITNKQFAQALYEAAKDLKGAQLKEAVKQFVLLLVRQHKFRQAGRIIAEFEKYAKKQAGIAEIKISSAKKLNKAILSGIKKIFGKKTEAEEIIEPSLIGGIMIRTEDKILDGSLKTQLTKLKQSLI